MGVIQYERVAPGRAFHAVLTRPRQSAVEHGHDFVELMLVVEGSGRHLWNGYQERLGPGEARRLGPEDRHALMPDPGGMVWINVAFPARAWQTFLALAQIDPPAAFRASRSTFDQAVRAYHEGAGGLALATFLVEVCAPVPSALGGPPWLAAALRADLVERGVSAMLEAACVSPSHLARAVRSATGRSPTQLVVERRLERAALRLATTTEEIAVIALDCGYPSLSYFYRAFRRRHGATPLEWRRRAQRSPEGGDPL